MQENNGKLLNILYNHFRQIEAGLAWTSKILH